MAFVLIFVLPDRGNARRQNDRIEPTEAEQEVSAGVFIVTSTNGVPISWFGLQPADVAESLIISFRHMPGTISSANRLNSVDDDEQNPTGAEDHQTERHNDAKSGEKIDHGDRYLPLGDVPTSEANVSAKSEIPHFRSLIQVEDHRADDLVRIAELGLVPVDLDRVGDRFCSQILAEV